MSSILTLIERLRRPPSSLNFLAILSYLAALPHNGK